MKYNIRSVIKFVGLNFYLFAGRNVAITNPLLYYSKEKYLYQILKRHTSMIATNASCLTKTLAQPQRLT